MKLKNITFAHSIADIYENCLDVRVTLEDDSSTNNEISYIIDLATPQFFARCLRTKKFMEPCNPYIIVSELTYETIRAAIEEYVNEKEDAFWLKLYYAVNVVTIEEINEIIDRYEQRVLKFDQELEENEDFDL